MSVSLRPIETTDYDEVMALWNASPGVNANESRVEFQRILGRNPSLGCVAVDGEAIVAAVLCCHDGRRGYLYHLAVAESHRGQGLARQMVERSIALLCKDGISRCTIFLFRDNELGAEIWQHLGYKERIDLAVMQRDF